MTGPDGETLTDALRRLTEEGASGMLAVAATPDRVLVRLQDGVPVAVGPRPDVRPRVGPGAPGPVASAAAVDVLLGRVVDVVLDDPGAWTWGVVAEEPLVLVPAGLADELDRRLTSTTDAAARVPASALVVPRPADGLTGELAVLHGRLGAGRDVAALAVEAGLPRSTTRVLVATLVDLGAAAVEAPATDLRSDDRDADGSDVDEPELWVMAPEPAPDTAPSDEATQPDSPAPPITATSTSTSAAELVGDDWADTAWLDELDEPPRPAAPAAPAAPISEPTAPAARGAPVADPDDATDEPAAPPSATTPPRPSPRADPDDVSEFLRELSRLALEDD